jgi:homoserine kinase
MSNGRIKTASFGPSVIGVIIVFGAFAIVAWVLFRFAAPMQTNEDARAKKRSDAMAAVWQEAQEKLESPAKWIDKSKGTVQLPIETAMVLVENDYQVKPVAPSAVKVENPYPAGLGLGAPAPAAVTGSAATTGSSSAEVKK